MPLTSTMGSRGRESTAVRHESSAIRIVGGVSRSFGSVCDIVTPLIMNEVKTGAIIMK